MSLHYLVKFKVLLEHMLAYHWVVKERNSRNRNYPILTAASEFTRFELQRVRNTATESVQNTQH